MSAPTRAAGSAGGYPANENLLLMTLDHAAPTSGCGVTISELAQVEAGGDLDRLVDVVDEAVLLRLVR